jgi:hypothetical protein
MAAKASSGEKTGMSSKGRDIAINKTRGLAFARNNEQEDWQAIDPKGLTELQDMERVSHIKIGDNWFSIYRAGSHS